MYFLVSRGAPAEAAVLVLGVAIQCWATTFCRTQAYLCHLAGLDSTKSW